MLRKLENRRRRMGNKGFSLVELIIVIAILAVLVAILAPQYLKYVENSRKAADEANADQLLKAVQVAMTDEDVVAQVGLQQQTITFNSSGITIPTTLSLLIDELESTLGVTFTTNGTCNTKKVISNTYKNSTYTIIINTDGSTTGSWGTTPPSP